MEGFHENGPPACTGGFHAVAEALGWRTQRRRKHASVDIDEAAALVKGYLDSLPKGSPAQGQMPKLSDLAASGHHDVHDALKVRESSLLITALLKQSSYSRGGTGKRAPYMACARPCQRRGGCQRSLISLRLSTAEFHLSAALKASSPA